jgi:hypothetical protein
MRRSASSLRCRRLIIRAPSSDATINVATALASTPGRVSRCSRACSTMTCKRLSQDRRALATRARRTELVSFR